MKAKINWFKRFSQWLDKKLEGYYYRRYYTELDSIPIWNWWMIHEKKDFKYLLIGKGKLTKHAAVIFDNLYSDFIRIFGVSDSYKDYLNKLIEIESAEIDRVINKDESLQTFIDIMHIELKEIKERSMGGSYIDGAIAVEKHMGFKLDQKSVSVFEYYSYIKNLEKTASNGSK